MRVYVFIEHVSNVLGMFYSQIVACTAGTSGSSSRTMSIVSTKVVDDIKVVKMMPLMKSGMGVAGVGLGLYVGLFFS